MPDIRYVSLSDTHFGADNSLLTHLSPGSRSADPMRPSRVLETFVECLRALIARNEGKEKPTLVLNGDILELALTTDNRAAMAFERFLELAFPPGEEALFANNIYYLPGNHDHHLWETAREAQYLDYIAQNHPSKPLAPPWHATNLFLANRKALCPANFLDTLARRRNLGDVSFITAYPNLGLVSSDERRAVIFTHGHFAESIYTLVTKLMTLLFPERLKPTQVWDLEAENFAWIDFFWSALGRSGQAGENVGLIYDKLQDKAAFDELLGNLARGLAQGSKVPGFGTWMKTWLLHKVLDAVLGRVVNVEVQQPDVLSKDAESALRMYLEGPVRAQVLSERPSIPAEVTVVFGHTHKPFERVVGFQGYAEELRLYNSGGWVVDSLDPKANGGWAVVLLDEDLHATSLRFAPDSHGGNKAMCLAEAAKPGEAPNALHKRLQGLVDAGAAPWSDFLAAVKASAADHLENLKTKIRSPA
jgi:hypothetical protein